MGTSVKTLMVFGLVFSALSGCGSGGWQTSYADVVDAKVSQNWRVSSIDVVVPETLTVSEANTFAPNADIVWREESLGDRHAQVDAIMTEAAEKGAARFSGKLPVHLVIRVSEFHALTQKTRFTLQNSGVHNITFNAQVFDARTGQELSPVDNIRADLIGFSGDEAIAAIAIGQTQRVRIIDHVANVISGWLGQGPDVRGIFQRNGR